MGVRTTRICTAKGIQQHYQNLHRQLRSRSIRNLSALTLSPCLLPACSGEFPCNLNDIITAAAAGSGFTLINPKKQAKKGALYKGSGTIFFRTAAVVHIPSFLEYLQVRACVRACCSTQCGIDHVRGQN